ncbi:ATP-dependent helicase C-terminal domain-containing protein [Escherichia coli]
MNCLRITLCRREAGSPFVIMITRALAVRMQEMFGEATNPTIAQGRVPLVLELLSPAQRPLQITRDLSAFWKERTVRCKKR